jgi:hypothetical protein
MRRIADHILGLLFLTIGFLAIPMAVAAQDATAVASPPPGVIFPDPSECTGEPKPISFFEEMAATPPALPADADQRFWSPTQEKRPWTMPAGAHRRCGFGS